MDKEKILLKLKEIERKTYKKELCYINSCNNWKEFCFYCCDSFNKEPEIFIDKDSYVILNICNDEIEVVDIVSNNCFSFIKIIKFIIRQMKKYNIYTIYASIVNKRLFDKLSSSKFVKIINSEKYFDYDDNTYRYDLKFFI